VTSIKNYSNLTQRLITAFIGAAVIVSCIVFSEWTYFAIFFLICFLTVREFYTLAGLDGMEIQKAFGTVCAMSLFSLSFLVSNNTILPKFYFLIFPMLSCVYMIKLYKKFERKPFTNIAYTFLGIFYVAVPYSLLNIVVFKNGVYNFEIIFGCLFILWASDSGAYIAGTLFGKRKLFERISPKKSWEGFVGGAILAFAFAFLINNFFDSLALWQWLGVTAIIIIGGTYGDLIESLLKRSIEIKDSGSILPGHGGFLDRFDGLLISAPFIVAFLEIF